MRQLTNGRALFAKSIHDTRKRLKRGRAALRLVRAAIGSGRYHRENAALRDAARPLTEVRDADALATTIEKFVANGDLDHASSAAISQWIRDRQRDVRQRVRAENSVTPARKSLQAALKRIKKAPTKHDGWSVLETGLARVYRSAREAFAETKTHPTTQNFHEWRKQTKYLRYQLEMMQLIWPAALKGMANEFHQLADLLGDEHDLVVLRERLRQETSAHSGPPALEALVERIDRRQRELEDEALMLGQRLYADKPKLFTRQLRRHWRKWRG